MGATLTSTPCHYCREHYKVGGFQRLAHMRKHVREGLLTERRGDSRVEFDETEDGKARRREITDWRTTWMVVKLLREKDVTDLTVVERLLAVDTELKADEAGTPQWARRWWQKRRKVVYDAFVAAWDAAGRDEYE